MRLKDKSALITGAASKGIGRAIASAFAREGAFVMLADIDGLKLQEAEDEIRNGGGEVRSVVADISKPEDAEMIARLTENQFGSLDILVNNAGIIVRTPFLESTAQEWNTIFTVNVVGYFLCAQAAAKRMVNQKRGKIIMLSSDAALVGIPPLAAYASSKAAVLAMTRTAAIELAPYNINVNAIAPGTTLTDMTREKLADPAWRAQVIKRFPLGRLGNPNDIAEAAVFLASPESDWVTGHCLVVDGGHTAR
jgi:NAD(P)-dependent dehydrogenase (short-subunit alcohol dehydrogenase family)